jgi:hypothetical protein
MTGTGQRVSNIGDISEVNYTLASMKGNVPLWTSVVMYFGLALFVLVSLLLWPDYASRPFES